MQTKGCPFCKEEIKADAIKCKHCKSMLMDVSLPVTAMTDKPEGTLWLPVPSMVLGIIGFISLFDESHWDYDEIFGLALISAIGFILGIVSLNTQKTGKEMAIAGLVLSCLAGLSALGMLLD